MVTNNNFKPTRSYFIENNTSPIESEQSTAATQLQESLRATRSESPSFINGIGESLGNFFGSVFKLRNENGSGSENKAEATSAIDKLGSNLHNWVLDKTNWLKGKFEFLKR